MYLQVEWTSTTTSFQWNELPRPHHFSGMNFHDHIISVEWISTTTSFQWNELPRPHHFSGMNFHDHIISVRGDVWAHITSLTRHVTYCWSVCPKQGKWSVVYLCVRGIDFVSFYDFAIGFWNCSDSVVIWNCSDSVVFWNCSDSVVFWNCSDSVVFLELFRQCGILELFRQCGILELFRQCGILCLSFYQKDSLKSILAL
jgi:hypothetical protein